MVQQSEDTDKLPSEIIYSKFVEGTGCPVEYGGRKYKEEWERVLRGVLQKKGIDGSNLAVEIARTWCNVYIMRLPEEVPGYGPWDVFYFWLGDQIRGKLNGNNFSNVMGAMYKVLTKDECRSKCKNIYPGIREELFQEAKKLFEYYFDYNYLNTQKGSNKKSICGRMMAKLEEAKSAFRDISSLCNNAASDRYCRIFWGESVGKEPYKEPEPLTCPEGEAESLGPESRPGPDGRLNSDIDISGPKVDIDVPDVNIEGPDAKLKGSGAEVLWPDVKEAADGKSGSIVGSVSGGLVSVALPAIGFYLYKYTDVFDGIKKSLFGGLNNRNRGRRSTIRHQHFDDTFTGNDSSTLGGDGSTTLGGGGGESSTLGGSSTDISTIYDDGRRQPTGRTRTGTNNRRPGNIRYYAT
ncbi:KIR protein [Plasmodium knowlesi strain H]|uniref:KIR protein n=2 Tax=Plasmodium knowlesi TaxID=5850 RepID=B3L658_PLAKH|nr:KIR protein [Plasmodium knowlesi strain H]OTN67104.1 KIR protein [Plasmodium knowlesi]CAA9988630.1 KIR protein [Plasmodium knowlesi strain H]VVS78104.1 KIR protein [Plasmodium knowlesi strain H]|eukprot:XP_002259606.1 KIR protein [Plasmodium knowlesi strain H]